MKKLSALCVLLLLAGACGRGGDDDGGGGDNGGGDGGGDGDDTIFDVQSDAMPVGTAVTVRGVVVTAIDNFGSRKGGIYVQEPEGGPFSGVFVYLSGTEAADLEVGNLVDLEGFVKDEFAWQGGGCEGAEEDEGSLTELSPAEGVTPTVSVVGDGTVPEPEVVLPWELAASADEAEKWEGVPIRFENVRVQTAPAGVSDSDDTLVEMRVTGPFPISSSLTALDAAVGDCYASVTGIGDFFFDYKLLPRSAADLVAGDDGDCLPAENTLELCGDEMDNDYSGHGDCADFGCQAAVESCTIDTSIAAIQAGDVAENSRVRLENMVITGVSYNKKRYWLSDDVETAAANTGIYVFRPSSAEQLGTAYRTGATITVVANVDQQYAGCSGNAFTELTFVEPDGTPSGSGAGPAPLTDVDLATLASDTAGEPYEGVLVTIEKVKVSEINQNEDFNLEFTVTDGTASLVVDDDIFRYEDVAVDQCLNITGIMHYSTFDNSDDGGLGPHITIEPRSLSEIDSTTGCQ